ncbi:MAG: response regulator [Alphaproteobacteria bacterium]|nr:response regulator [Alphaproteobacteria bacterium]
MTAPLHILVVDDDERIRTMLRRYLVDEGFTVATAADGEELRGLIDREKVDLVLLDLMLPGEDGLSVARYLRQKQPRLPIIMLTGKGDLIDRVAGLEAGADDYVAKPFHLREVLARIRTVLRRAQPAEDAPAPAATPAAAQGGTVLAFSGWRLDLLKRELRREDGQPVALTSGEYDLLQALARSPNRVLNRDQLMDLVKGREWAATDRAIDTQIVRLRKKIERDPRNPQLIKTVRGAGYIFAATVARS